MKKEIFVIGKLSKDFVNVVEKEEYKIKNRTQVKEGVFVSIKDPEFEGEIDTSGMDEKFVPKWATESVEYYNGKTSYPLDLYDENAKKITIDSVGDKVPYGSEVKVALKIAKNGYYYPYALQIIKFNEEVVEDNPFA